MFEQYDEMITIDDLCQMLSIGYNAAYMLLRTSQIKAFKIGRIWKIPKKAVEKYILTQSRLI